MTILRKNVKFYLSIREVSIFIWQILCGRLDVPLIMFFESCFYLKQSKDILKRSHNPN